MKPFAEPIYVTRPLLPPLAALQARLAEVWDSRWLTNNGQQVVRLEEALRAYLGVPNLTVFNNGTIALLTAIRALKLTGDIITTPFTFPATPHAVTWSGLSPVFADIDPMRLTLSPDRVEDLITPETTAILAVHVYGVPCDVSGLQALADRHGLKLLYDGAHAFGTRVDGRAIGTFGDVTMFSFHATKLFHTAEGGALACRSADDLARFNLLKNFGILGPEAVDEAGINGKMNELQAALGLSVLDLVDEEVARRRTLLGQYRRILGGMSGVTLTPEVPGVETSGQYCAIRIDPQVFGCSRDDLFEVLREHNVFARKYFFPLCSDYECYRHLPSARRDRLPVANAAAGQVLCLPVYGELPAEAVERICEIVTTMQTRVV